MIEICDIISGEYSYEVFICYPKKACIANTSKEEAEIDRASACTCYAFMYALYGLSEDEIKIVEEK